MKIVIWLLLLTPLVNLGQATPPHTLLDSIPIDNTSQMVKYEGVEKASGSKDELFKKSRKWLAESFNPAAYVNLTQNKELGLITGKLVLPYQYLMYYSDNRTQNTGGQASFTINIYCKKNTFRYL